MLNKILWLISLLAFSTFSLAGGQAELSDEVLKQHQTEAKKLFRQAEKQMAQARLYKEKSRKLTREQQEKLSKQRRELRELQKKLQAKSRELSKLYRQHGHTAAARFPSLLQENGFIGVVPGYASSEGVKVISVVEDGPAARAGIQGDDIIVSVNGNKVGKTLGQGFSFGLSQAMREVEPDESVTVEVKRDDQLLSFTFMAESKPGYRVFTLDGDSSDADIFFSGDFPTVEIEALEFPELDERALTQALENAEKSLQRIKPNVKILAKEFRFKNPSDDIFLELHDFSGPTVKALDNAYFSFGLYYANGLQFSPLDKDLGRYFGTDKGVLVLQAEQDNYLDLRTGDVILSVAGDTVAAPADVMRKLRRYEPGDEIQLEIMRDGQSASIQLVLPERKDDDNSYSYSWSYSNDSD